MRRRQPRSTILPYTTLFGSTVNADLKVPELSAGESGAGKRVKQTLPGYGKTAVHHVLYLPTDWQAEKRWPVLVEYSGNGNYSNSFGDVSSGRPDGSKMGYGISGGKGFIWVCLPYRNASGVASRWPGGVTRPEGRRGGKCFKFRWWAAQ